MRRMEEIAASRTASLYFLIFFKSRIFPGVKSQEKEELSFPSSGYTTPKTASSFLCRSLERLKKVRETSRDGEGWNEN